MLCPMLCPMQSGGNLETMHIATHIAEISEVVTWQKVTLFETPPLQLPRRVSERSRRGVERSRPCCFGRRRAEPAIGPAWSGARKNVGCGAQEAPWPGIWPVCVEVSVVAAEEWRWRGKNNGIGGSDAGGGDAELPRDNNDVSGSDGGGGDAGCALSDDADCSPGVDGSPGEPVRVAAGGGEADCSLGGDVNRPMGVDCSSGWLMTSVEEDHFVSWQHRARPATVWGEKVGVEVLCGCECPDEVAVADGRESVSRRLWGELTRLKETTRRRRTAVEDLWGTAGAHGIGRVEARSCGYRVIGGLYSRVGISGLEIV